jgi:MFS family permease
VAGNLCYAAGLPCNSLALVIVGRLLNGFGSARAINRRYICDTFPREERTAASAAFVTAGALGMSVGPAIAAVFHYLATDSHGHEESASIYWQPENAPGWFMFGIWTIYLVCLVLCFEDPPKRKDATLKKAAVSLQMAGAGETSHLLGNGDGTNSENDAREPPIWRNIPVMTTFVIYFVVKLILECVLSATAVLTEFYFGWQSGLVGIYLAALGLLMLPANLCVAFFAHAYDDRELILGLQAIMFLGCVIILQFTDVYRLPQYVIASVVLFVSANALEGPNMSLLSKTIPVSWSKGIFNVGLLATEAGTLGRAIGDVLLTIFGSAGLEHLLNRTFGTFSILSFGTLLFSYYFYDQLDPSEHDD